MPVANATRDPAESLPLVCGSIMVRAEECIVRLDQMRPGLQAGVLVLRFSNAMMVVLESTNSTLGREGRVQDSEPDPPVDIFTCGKVLVEAGRDAACQRALTEVRNRTRDRASRHPTFEYLVPAAVNSGSRLRPPTHVDKCSPKAITTDLEPHGRVFIVVVEERDEPTAGDPKARIPCGRGAPASGLTDQSGAWVVPSAGSAPASSTTTHSNSMKV